MPRAFFRLAYSTRFGGGSTVVLARVVLDRARVNLLVDVDQHECRRFSAQPPFGANLGIRIEDAIRPLGAKRGGPVWLDEFHERVARAKPLVGSAVLRNRIADQAGVACALEEPGERLLGKGIARVSAADIRVRADEPALFDAPRPRRGQRTDWIDLHILPRRQVAFDPFELALGGVAADVGDKRCVLEAAAVLVDRQRMPAFLNQRRRPHVVMQCEAAADAGNRERIPTHSADGVVDAEVGNLHAPRPADQQFLGGVQCVGSLARHVAGRSRSGRFLLPDQPRIPDEIGNASELDRRVGEEVGERATVMLTHAADQAVGAPELVDGERCAAAQQAAGADEADERPRGECAAAESEDVDFVGGREGRLVLIVLDQPVVCGADVRLETEAEAAAGDRIERTRADAFEIELQLRDSVFVDALVVALRGEREMMQNVRRIVAVVPGAVEADCQPPNLCHQCTPILEPGTLVNVEGHPVAHARVHLCRCGQLHCAPL